MPAAPLSFPDGHAITSLHRAALQQTLVEHAQPGTLHLGMQCAGCVESGDDSVTAQFEDGSEEVGDGLIGDAAHAMTPNLGQGGAQAVEDGFVLANALADHRDDLGQALEMYERLRVARVRRLVQVARRFGKMAHLRNRWLQAIRNWVLRHTPERVRRKQVDEMYMLNYEFR